LFERVTSKTVRVAHHAWLGGKRAGGEGQSGGKSTALEASALKISLKRLKDRRLRTMWEKASFLRGENAWGGVQKNGEKSRIGKRRPLGPAPWVFTSFARKKKKKGLRAVASKQPGNPPTRNLIVAG